MAHEDDDVQDLEFGQREPGTYPWFKFWSFRWMGSDTVGKMSLAHQAIYVRLMCGIHMYGSLSRDVWALGKRLGLPYRPLLSWMEAYGSLCEILHDENCALSSTAQPLSFHSDKAAAKQYASTSEAAAEQCPCSSWTVPNFEKLQVLSRKSTPDVAGDKNRKDKNRGDSCSAPRGAAKGKPSSHVHDMVEVEIGGVKEKRRRLRDSGCCDLCNVRNPGDPDPHCDRCSGRGSYSEPNKGAVPCDCGDE